MMSGQLPPAEQEVAPLPPSKSPTLTAYGIAEQVPIPMFPAHGGSPAGARIVRPKAGLGGPVLPDWSTRSPSGMSILFSSAPVAPSMTYARPASTRMPPVKATSTPSAVIRRSGTPSAGPTVAFGQVAFAAPPGQLPRSLKGAEAAFIPILPM